MDPVSLSLSIAGILPLVATALKSARSYMTTVLNAKQSITILITELQALQVSLKSLNELLSSAALGTTGIKFHSSSVLLSCSAACDAQLRSLCEKLRCESKGRMSRYLWPLSEKEHKETVQQLRNFTNWMQFALSIDGCRLLSRTSDDVVRVMSQQLDQFKSVQALESSIPQLYDAVQEQSQILRDNANSKTRRNILDWISTAKYDQKHHVLQSSRARNTGNWILHRVEYHCWKDGSSLSNVLWCHGVQGSGKTNLTSIIIDEILESTSSSTCPLAFIYFDYQEHKIQTPLMVWSSILRQLVEMISNGRKSIIDRYENAHHLTKSLSLHECERMILDLVQSLECAYLVIDAIDECDGSRFRRSILQFLDHLVKTSKVRVLVTSRPHIQDIHSMFCQSPQIKIEAQKEDLKTYLREELLSGGMYSIADEDFANKVIRALTARAEGMFLLPVLQVRTILNEPTLGDMEDHLEELSGNLGQAFEETIARIKRQPGNRSHIGMRALMYLAHSKRLLDVAELSDALAVRPKQTKINPKYRPSPDLILECCQGLVVIGPETTDVRPAHYTIQEYLVGHSEQLFPRAEVEIASSCLKYLLFEDFEDGPLATEDEIESRICSCPFLVYAAQYYGEHARPEETDPEVWKPLLQFFDTPAATATETQISNYKRGYRREYWDQDECRSRKPLHLASGQGLDHALNALLESGQYGVNNATKIGTTAIHQAASGGHVSSVRILLRRGADPYLRNWYGNAFHCAIEGGFSSTIRELVSWGMDPNPIPHHGPVPILCALDNDSAEAFETLVELGATLSPDKHLHLFHRAALEGCERIIGVIIRRGWADLELRCTKGFAAGQGHHTALHYATMASDPGALKRLIEAGADVNSRDDRGRTPLDWAVTTNLSQSAIRLLLAAGAVAGQSQPPARQRRPL